jgi:hypothetical protein
MTAEDCRLWFPGRQGHRHSSTGKRRSRAQSNCDVGGGRCRARTDDLLVVSQLLYQLS